jgi:hypothetical protein
MLWIVKLLFDQIFMQISDQFRFNFDELYPFGTLGVDSYK